MSEAFRKQAKHPVATSLGSTALLGLLLTLGSAHAMGEDLEAYGARMCIEAGIPLENCSLVTDPAAVPTAALARDRELDHLGDKTATLLEHGRRVCEQENVPLEDCQALPAAYRAERASATPAAAFLTVPEAVPAVDAALVPAPAVVPAPAPARQRAMHDPRPPAPLPARPVPTAPVLVGEPDIRYLRPPAAPPPPPPAYRYAPAAAPAAALPIEPEIGYVRPPTFSPEPFAFRDAPPPPVDRRLSPVFAEEPPQRFRGTERLVWQERSSRCLRAVRYASYRYVTC